MCKICLANQSSLNNIKLSFALRALQTETKQITGGWGGISLCLSLFAYKREKITPVRPTSQAYYQGKMI